MNVLRILAMLATLANVAAAQHEHHTAPPTPPQKQSIPPQPANPAPSTASQDHSGHGMPALQPEMPRLGRSQSRAAGQLVTLEQLEQFALKNNPTLAQAEAGMAAARGRRAGAGLLPNPTVGYTGEEIRGGALRGGQHGFFVEQEIVLGGKLGKARLVQDRAVQQAEAQAARQRMRVLGGVRQAYFRALAAQEMVDARVDLSRLAADAVVLTRQLANIGQADEADVLQSEIEADQAELDAAAARAAHHTAWAELTAVIGQPQMPPAVLAGNLEQDSRSPSDDELVARLLDASPEAKLADLSAERAAAAVQLASSQRIPNLNLRGGLQQSRELLESSGRPVGLQGFAEIGVQLPIFNRQQGIVAAAGAEAERARQEAARVRLRLRQRAAALASVHSAARDAVERYRTRMLPRAQRAYTLMLQKYAQMAAAYSQVLTAQRTLFQLQAGYIEALERLGTSSVSLQGMLQTGALDSPGTAGDASAEVEP